MRKKSPLTVDRIYSARTILLELLCLQHERMEHGKTKPYKARAELCRQRAREWAERQGLQPAIEDPDSHWAEIALFRADEKLALEGDDKLYREDFSHAEFLLMQEAVRAMHGDRDMPAYRSLCEKLHMDLPPVTEGGVPFDKLERAEVGRVK